jgi:hypothetical protein
VLSTVFAVAWGIAARAKRTVTISAEQANALFDGFELSITE